MPRYAHENAIRHSGSPEGYLSAEPGIYCLDTVANQLYCKAFGSGNTGWFSLTSQGQTWAHHLESDQTTNLVALSDINDLVFPVHHNTAYVFQFCLFYTAASSANGIGIAVNGPALGSNGKVVFSVETQVSSSLQINESKEAYNTIVQASTSLGPTVLKSQISGYLMTGEEDGLFAIRFNSSVDGQEVTTKRGSWGHLDY